MNALVYVAAPYSHPDQAVIEERMRLFYKAMAFLMKKGFVAFSPLYNHPVVIQEGIPTDWEYWRLYSITMLERSSKMIVLRLSGWEQSSGVRGEIEFCREHNIPVEYLDVADFDSVQG